MDNAFTKHPVVVTVLGVDSLLNGAVPRFIKQQIVWTGTKNRSINELWRQNKISKLRSHYGSNFPSVVVSPSKGGAINTDQEAQEDTSDDNSAIPFDDDDIETLLTSLENDDIAPVVSTATTTAPRPAIVSTAANTAPRPLIVVDDIFIFPEDKVSEFKLKIHAATGIPPYRQHLWYETSSKNKVIGHPLSYEIFGSDSPLRVDINALTSHTTYYEGLPIDTNWYALKDSLRVAALDEFILLDNIYSEHRTTSYYVVDLNDFINPIRGDLERLLKRDLYPIELIYYSFILKYWPQLTLSVFGEYILNPAVVGERYPDLSPGVAATRTRFKLETSIIGTNYSPVTDTKKWDTPLHVSITRSVISVTNYHIPSGSTVHLRNLFDVMELGPELTFAVCNLEIESRPVLLTKRYKTAHPPLTLRVAPNSILFNVVIHDHGNLHLIINKNGSYKIESRWREDQYLDFQKIYAHVETYIHPIIARINTHGKIVSSPPRAVIRGYNSSFTDLSVCMFWKRNISRRGFETVASTLETHVGAGILARDISGPSPSLNYYLVKGMTKYNTDRYNTAVTDPNQYSYLTDQSAKNTFATLITHRKRLSVAHRFSDVRIELMGLREEEYVTAYLFILRLLASLPRAASNDHGQSSTTKRLKQLKEKDPLLYEFKKVYDSDLVYSKICQRQKQPLVHTDTGVNRVKFWNFTTQEPAYYECPNPAYPHVNFITGVHPKNYCIPCCYKLPPSNKYKKSTIYSDCLTNKTFEPRGKDIVKSRYIMAYGKDVDVGRLSRLPETTLEPLLYDTYSSEVSGIDDECAKRYGYYLFGVPQDVKNVANVGFLFSVAHALGKNIIEFVAESVLRMRGGGESWGALLSGEILTHFRDLNHLAGEMYDVFVGDKLSDFDRWNALFMGVATIYWDIFVVHFVDLDGAISLEIPGYIRHPDDYASSRRHLVVIERDHRIYPIYAVDRDLFFSIDKIEVRLFEATSVVVGEIRNLALHYIGATGSVGSILDLHLIRRFTKNARYTIETLYVNSSNFCYGVLLRPVPDKKVVPFYDEGGGAFDVEPYDKLAEGFNAQAAASKERAFYVPISESYYKIEGIPISFAVPGEVTAGKWVAIKAFIEAFNHFVEALLVYQGLRDGKPKQMPPNIVTAPPLIYVERWLMFGAPEHVVGFTSNATNYSITATTRASVSSETLPSGAAIPFVRLRYDPRVVNTAIHARGPLESDGRSATIDKSLYSVYLYQILIIELLNVVNRDRNNTVRKAIASVIESKSGAKVKVGELATILEKYPDDFAAISRLVSANLMSGVLQPPIITQGSKMTRGEIAETIERSVYSFDRQIIESLTKMGKADLYARLVKIFSATTIDADPVLDGPFPNMLVACESSLPYCSGKKLAIRKEKLLGLLDIMAADILNPVRSRHMFNEVFVKNTIDYFRFIVRDGEHITIEM